MLRWLLFFASVLLLISTCPSDLEAQRISGPTVSDSRVGYIEEASMQHKHPQFGHGFRVVLGNKRSQAAQMTLDAGESEGGPDNRHRGADQWLYVVGGSGEAIVNGERVELRAGTLLLIERGDRHEIRNTGQESLRTLNLYVPPAYTEQGEELRAGRP